MANDIGLTQAEQFEVGGIRLARPFKIRRLGHFGFNVSSVDTHLKFYRDLLGFRASDRLDFGARLGPEKAKEAGETAGVFMRHGTDHHSFVLFPRKAREMFGVPFGPEITINQITWQVGTLREVVDATRWLGDHQVKVARSGRDLPGSNWHCYPYDPEGHQNEIYYGIEQIGWDGLSKPLALYKEKFDKPPELPRIGEIAEIKRALKDGVDLTAGLRQDDAGEAKYDVGGIMVPRPFKIVRIGPVRLFVKDMEAEVAYYRDMLGFTVTEQIAWNGHRCVFLRAGTEHHSLALYPKALRAELDFSPHSTCMAFGCQVGSYQQLKDAVAFLKQNGIKVRMLDPALFPGIDYSALAFDPDGHAIQLYYAMEQVGWDGKPRPAAMRRPVNNERWPDAIEPLPDTFGGEPFLGPIG
jgi:catechol 2,3-dioxygenase-like lactoylglutathione lyase family enzyme